MKKINLIRICSLVVLTSYLFTGCGAAKTATSNDSTAVKTTDSTVAGSPVPSFTPATRTVTNIDGTNITVPGEVKRVVTTFGPAYEKVFMLGAEDKIVADGDFHINSWPWSNVIYKNVNQVPGIPNAHVKLNIEDLMKYKPDVVFHFSKPDEIEKMNSVGIGAIPYATTNKLEDTKTSVMVYAKALGSKEEQVAKEYVDYFDEKLKMVTDITAKLPDSERPNVYFSNQEILWTAGKDCDIPEVISAAGGNCVSKDTKGGSKTEINMEQLLQWNPQYIFVDHAGSSGNASAEEVISKMVTDDRLKKVSAISDNKVYICPTGVFFWDSGVQKILMVMWMAKTLHPDKFKDIDMTKELKNFYSKFFRYDLTDEQAAKILAHLNP